MTDVFIRRENRNTGHIQSKGRVKKPDTEAEYHVMAEAETGVTPEQAMDAKDFCSIRSKRKARTRLSFRGSVAQHAFDFRFLSL